MNAINWADVFIMVIILFNVIIGIRQGIIRGIIDLIGVIVAIFLAIFWFKAVGENISSHSQISVEIANILSFAIIFLGVCLIARMIGIFFKKIFSLLFVSWIDGLGGALFGLTKGFVIVGILFS